MQFSVMTGQFILKSLDGIRKMAVAPGRVL
jgi:hypothetical protein